MEGGGDGRSLRKRRTVTVRSIWRLGGMGIGFLLCIAD